MASGSDTSYWLNFFKECDIPAGDSANYAVTFTDNRIQKDMLNDLTKEYLNDMGITILGDVISILKHAKTVHIQEQREKTLRGTTSASSTPRRSTAASRIVGHYLGNDPDAAPMNLPVVPKISRELSARLGTPPSDKIDVGAKPSKISKIKINPKMLDEVVPVPKSRRVFPEHEGKYKITMPSGSTDKTKKILQKKAATRGAGSSVFERLGADKSTRQTTVTNSGSVLIKSSSSSVFNRLGGKTTIKRAATSTVDDLDDDDEDEDVYDAELEYAGVLKSTPSPKKKTKITITAVQTKKKVITPVEPPVTTAGILSSGATPEPKTLQQRLGKKVSTAVVSSTTSDDVASAKPGIKRRLGVQKGQDTKVNFKITKTIDTGVTSSTGSKKGVFSRLGKGTS